MKSFDMETGYINEDEIEPVMETEGGQMKTKNGQKYVVNHYHQPRPIGDGYYIGKCGVFVYLFILAAMMAITSLITYFLFLPSCAIQSALNGHHYNNSIELGGVMKISNDPVYVVSNGNGDSVAMQDDPSVIKVEDKDRVSTAIPIVNTSKEEKGLEDEIEFHQGWLPIKYDLLLEPDIENSLSHGSVSIRVTRDNSVKGFQPIVLDIKDIEVHNCKVIKVDSTDLEEQLISDCQYGKNNNSYIIIVKENKESITDLIVDLEFTSKLTDTMQGFYKGTYNDSKSKNLVEFLSTQFSPIDARRAFPCFDDPGKKATFKISLIRPAGMTTSISNMPLKTTIDVREGFVKDEFEETPKMSTYLVAFHLSDLVLAQESESNMELPNIRFWTRDEYRNMTDFGFQMTSSALPFFEDYFGVKFRLPKIDIVAVPDFGFNAMENWGLITFREAALLTPAVHNKSSSIFHMRKVAMNLAHEIAHQWFGNLVTMKWFDDLWLKEGFATYLSYVAVDKIKPEWHHLETFPLYEMNKAMEKDSDSFSRPISFHVKSHSDVQRIFDPISYSKGACLTNMMRGFLGEQTFRDALKNYLTQFEYGTAQQDDLWRIMTREAHKSNTFPQYLSVKEIMDSWTLQSGYPIVTLTRNGSDVIITQKRFVLPMSEDNVSDSSKWIIPISFATSKRTPDSEVPEYWLTDQVENLRIENVVDEDDFIYLNVNRTGYYRVNYDDLSWKQLLFKLSKLPPIARAQMIDDAFHLARANIVKYDVPLTIGLMLNQLPNDYLSWWAYANGIEYLSNMVKRESAYEAFRAITRYLIKNPYAQLGFDEREGETHTQLLHRARMVKIACDYGIDRCTNRAQILYREWISDKLDNRVPPNLKEVIYCTSMREGGEPEWNFAHKQYLGTTSASEKEMLLSSLGCTEKPWLLSKYLNMTLYPESGIKKQDGARAFASVAKNAFGYEMAYDFLYTNIQQIADYFGDGFSTLSIMIDALTTNMNKEYHKDQFRRFSEKARKLGLVAIEKSIKLAEIEIDKNIYWRKNVYDSFKDLMDKFIKDVHININ